MMSDQRLRRGLNRAVRQFWETRTGQTAKQQEAGRTDQGARGAVTGCKQMDGFIDLVRTVVEHAGLSSDCVHTYSKIELPGYFRPEKQWDLIVVDDDALLAAIEFKSHVGPSFSNNFNNRCEEAIGNATDVWTAFREGAFAASERPWLGYLMLLEDCPKSTKPISVRQPHFKVFEEFHDTSYAQRYRILIEKLLRERLYDSACFLTSSQASGLKGAHASPDPSLTFARFATALSSRIDSHCRAKRS